MNYKEKTYASCLHLLGSVLLAAAAGWLVFSLWYPNDLAKVAKGTEIYWLVFVIDVVLGPVLSFVIYNSAKAKVELVRDYTVIILIQLAAVVYGLYVIAQSRPVYIVFVKDSFELLSASQYSEKDLNDASTLGFGELPLFGPKLVCAVSPSDPVESSDLMFSAIDGKDIQFFPKYYSSCDTDVFMSKAYPKLMLEEILEAKGINVALAEDDFTWLPFKTRFDTWVEVYPSGNYSSRYYLEIDPYYK